MVRQLTLWQPQRAVRVDACQHHTSIMCRDRSMDNLGLYGSLPASWASAAPFATVRLLSLANNNITGTLPSEWGSTANVWPALQAMLLYNNSLQGFVPSAWMSFGNELTYTYAWSVSLDECLVLPTRVPHVPTRCTGT